jgi:hypothetical protein
MANWKLKGLRGEQRRRFLKLMGLAAAGVGLERSGFLNYVADQAGHEAADAVADAGLFLAVPAPNGVEAWFQSMWPVGATAFKAAGSGLNNPTNQALVTGSTANNQAVNIMPWLYTTGAFPNQHGYNETSVAGISYGKGNGYPGYVYQPPESPGRYFVYGPDAAFFNFATNKPTYGMTAIVSGRDETHTDRPISQNQIGSNRYVSAAVAAIQVQALSSIAPVIGIDPVAYDSSAGTKGAPEITTVPNAAGMIELFNSAASRFTLNTIEDQKLFETYYNAVSGLRGPAPRSTWQPQLKIAKGAAKLIGLNFAAGLTPTATDLSNYGITAMNALTSSGDVNGQQQPQATAQIHTVSKLRLEAFGRCLITAARAMKLGLTNAAIISLSPLPTSDVFFTDPHETFTTPTNMRGGRSITRHLGLMLNAFYADLATAQLDKKCVSMYYGDTPHSPAEKGAWPDATVRGSNWIYLMSHGYIKEGWFGQPMGGNGNSGNGGNIYGFDRYGNNPDSMFMNVSSDTYSTAAGAAVAYSVARGDWNTAAEFYSGAKITGLIKA